MLCEVQTLVHLKLELDNTWFLEPNEKIEVSSKQGASVCQMQHMDTSPDQELGDQLLRNLHIEAQRFSRGMHSVVDVTCEKSDRRRIM